MDLPVASPRPASAALDPFRTCARDVMRTDLLVLRADDSIRSAAEQFEEIHISGAPVVDANERLLGVLTLSDIARSEHVDGDRIATTPPVPGTDYGDEDTEIEALAAYGERIEGRARVVDWMSPGVTCVAPETTLAAVCRIMLDDDIHRVFVAEGGRLCGVVSTKDVVRLLAEPAAVQGLRLGGGGEP